MEKYWDECYPSLNKGYRFNVESYEEFDSTKRVFWKINRSLDDHVKDHYPLSGKFLKLQIENDECNSFIKHFQSIAWIGSTAINDTMFLPYWFIKNFLYDSKTLELKMKLKHPVVVDERTAKLRTPHYSRFTECPKEEFTYFEISGHRNFAIKIPVDLEKGVIFGGRVSKAEGLAIVQPSRTTVEYF